MTVAPKYKIITYGCQMNKSDSERIDGLLQGLGWGAVDKIDDADLIIINTCSVRQTAEDRVYGQMKNFLRLKKKKPHLLVGVTGCMAGRDKSGELRKKLPFVDLFFNISDLPKLPEMIGKCWNKTIGNRESDGKETDYLGISPKPAEWWRGWVVIQTGCSNYCTYCVVPYARGHEKNRPEKDILKEARKMAAAGAKEIVLLGQTVNSHPHFVQILKKINEIPGINRISFASAHPVHMTDEVILALKLPKMADYLHLPVQSGNNEILAKMNRKYTRAEYLNIIKKIRKAVPGISLATDIIVGFPGETKKQFLDTVSLYKQCDFDLSYTAMYSSRTGTAACRAFKDNVLAGEKRRRWLVLQELMEKTALRKNKKYFGKVVEVLVDGCKTESNPSNNSLIRTNKRIDGKCWGFSREYKKTVFNGNKNLIGQVVNVKIDRVKEWELEGKIINKKPKLIVILGPTASGKTALAVKLARKFNGEIINADSRAIYKDMKVATARPGAKEGGVRHHLINFVRPDKDFSLAEYKKLAIEKINDILRRGKTPFLVGGTWLYIRAVVDNLDIPQVMPNKKFRKKLYKQSAKVLYNRLKNLDPEAAAKIHKNDKRRVIRALEVIHFSGKKISEQQKAGEPLYDVLELGIRRNLDEIEKRARVRIKKEMGEKLISETRKLLKKYSPDLPSMTSLGYREIGEYLRKKITKAESFELLAKSTRQFARYQLNTFGRDKRIKWVKNYKEAKKIISSFQSSSLSFPPFGRELMVERRKRESRKHRSGS